MKIGYAEQNLSKELDTGRTFRLNALTPDRQAKAIDWNFDAFFDLLDYNIEHNLHFFRLSAEFVPFAAHPQRQVDWRTAYNAHFETAGRVVRDHGIRLCMLANGTMINSPRTRVSKLASDEVCALTSQLDSMRLDLSHRVLLNIGGVFGDKKRSIQRFIDAYCGLDPEVQQRLALTNDDDYTANDCLKIRDQIAQRQGAIVPPVAFNVYEHLHNHGGDPMIEMFTRTYYTWHGTDAKPIVLYAPEPEYVNDDTVIRVLNAGEFIGFLQVTRGYDYDIIIEATDHEQSAERALALAMKIHPRAAVTSAS